MARRAPRQTVPTVKLAGNLDLTAAAPLLADLLARQGRDLTVDASMAQRLGGQCLQVLLAARTAWAASGHNFQVVGASAEFAEAAALLGAADLVSAGGA